MEGRKNHSEQYLGGEEWNTIVMRGGKGRRKFNRKSEKIYWGVSREKMDDSG